MGTAQYFSSTIKVFDELQKTYLSDTSDFSLSTQLRKAAAFKSASTLQEWDESTYCPAGASAVRAEDQGIISGEYHEILTSSQFTDVIERLSAYSDQMSDQQRNIVERMLENVRDYRKFPTEFIIKETELHANGHAVWKEAKNRADFSLAAPILEQIVECAIQRAEYRGYSHDRYDALLYDYEPGLLAAPTLQTLNNLCKRLTPLIQQLAAHTSEYRDVPPHDILIEDQERVSLSIAHQIGYDLNRGRLDHSAHPFATDISGDDVRITSRFTCTNLLDGLFSVLHETGHAIYMQGIPAEYAGTALGTIESYSAHESQARFWEIMVGQSVPFTEFLSSQFKTQLPKHAHHFSPEALWRALNRVQPSLIRIEADPITYQSHIFIRTILEHDLVNQKLNVANLPQRWKEMYGDTLGVIPNNDAEGALQDMHWYTGDFGYFPTYSLGTLFAAALQQKMRSDLPEMDSMIAEGNFKDILVWLRTQVHCHASQHRFPELVIKSTGEALCEEPFLKFLRERHRI